MKALLVGALFLSLSSCMTTEDRDTLEAQRESVIILKHQVTKLQRTTENLQEQIDRQGYWRDMRACRGNKRCRALVRRIWVQMWNDHGN